MQSRLNAARTSGHVFPPTPARGFTLVELLVVMGIIVVLIGLVVPAISKLLGSRGVTAGAYQIAGTLEQARTYALANHTYVWVGFTEENAGAALGTTPAVVVSPTDPGGRVILSVVASADGTSYRDPTVSGTSPAPFSTGASPTNQVTLVQISKLIKVEGIHLASTNNGTSASTNYPVRPAIKTPYQVGDPSFAQYSTDGSGGNLSPNTTTFKYPLSGTAAYTFTKTIEFNPQGEASKIVDGDYNGPQPWMEVSMQPTHGNAIDPAYQGGNSSHAAAAVLLEGITGRVQVVLP